MDFGEYLRKRQVNNKFASVKDHFEGLGGEGYLGITLRHFQQISSGKRPPNEKLLNLIFNKVRPSERKEIISSYFCTVLSDARNSDNLVSYIDQYLYPSIETSEVNVWDSTKERMFFTEEQIDFLTKNEECLKLHQRLVLTGSINLIDCHLERLLLQQMENLYLIKIQKNEITPYRDLFRIPTYENSSPKLTSKGTNLIIKFLDCYISKEGSSNQEVVLQMQHVTPDVAKRVLEQVKSFKKWVQSLAVDPDKYKGELVPFFFSSFAKKLEKRDL